MEECSEYKMYTVIYKNGCKISIYAKNFAIDHSKGINLAVFFNAHKSTLIRYVNLREVLYIKECEGSVKLND